MFGWKRSLLLVMAGFAIVGFQLSADPPSAMAQGSAEENLYTQISKFDEEANKNTDKAQEALAEQFGVPKEEIQSLLNEKLTYGNVAALLAVSSASGKTQQEVLGLVKSGKKWGEIANQLGVNLGAVVAKVEEAGNKVGAEASAKPRRKPKFAPGT
jgi:DNA-binding NarL/FixJ family response regulator